MHRHSLRYPGRLSIRFCDDRLSEYRFFWRLWRELVAHSISRAIKKQRTVLYWKTRSIGRALALGIFNNVFEDASFENEALAMAKQIASGPPIAIAFMKEHINRAVTRNLRSNLAMEQTVDTMCSNGDHKEAVKAFMEKRTPVFTGE